MHIQGTAAKPTEQTLTVVVRLVIDIKMKREPAFPEKKWNLRGKQVVPRHLMGGETQSKARFILLKAFASLGIKPKSIQGPPGPAWSRSPWPLWPHLLLPPTPTPPYSLRATLQPARHAPGISTPLPPLHDLLANIPPTPSCICPHTSPWMKPALTSV